MKCLCRRWKTVLSAKKELHGKLLWMERCVCVQMFGAELDTRVYTSLHVVMRGRMYLVKIEGKNVVQILVQLLTCCCSDGICDRSPSRTAFKVKL